MEVDLRRLQRSAAEGADRQREARRVTRKVAVIGVAGSGKTTVSRALAARMDVPHVELDSLFWKPGWQETPAEQFAHRVAAVLDADGWVADGNYRGKLGTLVLDRADLVVWLDLPLRITLARVLRRTVGQLRTREQLWGTNVETWRDAFLRGDSLVWWAVKTHFRWRRRLPQLLARYPHVRLRSQREIEQFLGE